MNEKAKTLRSVIVLEEGKVFEYKTDDDEAAIYLYLKLQVGKERQEVYLRDIEGKDYRLIPKIDFKYVKAMASEEIVYLNTAAHILHDSIFQKREKK